MKRSSIVFSLLLVLPGAVIAAAPVQPMSGTDAWSTTRKGATVPGPGAPAAVTAPVRGAPPAANSVPVSLPPASTLEDSRALDEQIQAIKKDVVDLNRDLFVLEEELLFPANTQVAVFLSMDVGEFFALDTVELRMDDKQVAKHLYTAREAEALLKGGVQRLFLGNLRVGSHELVALFTGKGPAGQDYSRGATLKFEKSVGAKYVELRVSDRQIKRQPEFLIKDWE
ncbi:MAG: AraC family transcriptional regulator [Steroidobacteraceae bacterium]